ncbi:TPA: SHOCT domain-containing protein [Staphylococcus aureus]|nr:MULTISPECIES: SHOCT domain-containing protein [Staphylococcus]MDW3961060.1 SHOCT domain-containing protein [Staphylococcus saprophyticus]MCJ8089993.1 SHOCT domain-containing protein [Staphylococcus aureus]MDE3375037.1 SHOCT domain-containing protein [Staphylococcus aureus]MDW4312949.1 SHOCT domain-containing protein [Staphylococcus saprophyticus]MDW4517175.1 SHOCT domain-containing protein [Staphylococcus saprophyticus]
MRKLLVLLLSGIGNVGIILLKNSSIIGPFCGTMNCLLLLILKTLFWDTNTPYGIIVKQERRKGLTNCMGIGNMMGGMGFIGMIFWIIILGLLFYGVYILIAKASEKPKGVRSDDSLQILKERLAKGEINEDEYEKLKKVLKKD